MSSSMGYRAQPLPTHKAKARWRRSSAQARVKRARQQRKLDRARGIVPVDHSVT